jgi:hypothetical protein
MDEALEQVGIVFPARDEPAETMQPTDTSFDPIAADVASEGATILPRRLAAVGSMGANQFDPTPSQAFAKPIGVSGLVVHQSPRRVVRQLALLDEPLDPVDFVVMSSRGKSRQRRSLCVDHQQDARAVPLWRAADLVTPLFARENEPSPIASSQLTRWSRSSLPRTRSHAAWKAPLRVQSRCRLQQVEGEGYRSGKSFQRLPEVRIQRIPSRQARDETRGRPPWGEAGGLAKKSAIRSHCESVRNGEGAILDPVQFDRRRGGHRNRVMNMSVSPFTDAGMQLACHSLFS